MHINEILKKDFEYIEHNSFADVNQLKGKTIFITGATGLIGTNIVNSLLHIGNINLIVLVRDKEKAKSKFIESTNILYIEGTIELLPRIEQNIDYIIHLASPTQSKEFIEKPVEIYKTILQGTFNTLELARLKKVKKYIYVSSVEAYGTNNDEMQINESNVSIIYSKEIRNSYPIAKLCSENLCFSYVSEYNVNALAVRLAQTFGPGVELSDDRVFAQFAKSVINNKNIVLKTKGQTKRSYIYTADVVVGLLGLLSKGKSGEIYNLCNENTYCSIYEMAKIVASSIANDRIEVQISESNESSYLPTTIYNMSGKKIKEIGFEPCYGLETMFSNMIERMKEESN